MARRFIRPRLVDLSGNVLRDGWLRVLDPDTAAEVDVFATSAGGSALTQPLTTDVRGEVECWLDAGTSVDLEWSDSGATKIAATGRTVSFDTFTEFVDADPVAVANTHAALPDLATSGHPASVISGLGGAALLNVGSGAGTVAAGDDSRITGAVPKSLVDAAGDLLVGTAADTVARLPLGTALQVLRVNAGATAPEWAAASSGAVSVIARTVLGADAASVDFSNIPATYESLMVTFVARATSSSTWVRLLMRCNNDSAANYESALYYQASGIENSTAQTAARVAVIPDASATAGWAASGQVDIAGYARTVFKKSVMSDYGAQYAVGTTSQLAGIGQSVWVSSSAINQLTFLSSSGNLLAGSVFTLYGIAGA